jgi:hypothetical protein
VARKIPTDALVINADFSQAMTQLGTGCTPSQMDRQEDTAEEVFLLDLHAVFRIDGNMSTCRTTTFTFRVDYERNLPTDRAGLPVAR